MILEFIEALNVRHCTGQNHTDTAVCSTDSSGRSKQLLGAFVILTGWCVKGRGSTNTLNKGAENEGTRWLL